MKVLYLIDTLEIGGTERSLLEIARHFGRVEPIMCHLYFGDALKCEYEAAGIRVISLNLDKNREFTNAVRRVRDIVRCEKPDLIHANLFHAEQVGRVVAKLEGIPVVGSFVNDSYGQRRRAGLSLKRRLKLSLVQRVDAFTSRWVTQFTSNSFAIAQSNAQALGVRPGAITVIHRGRDPRPFEPGAVCLAVVRNARGRCFRGRQFLNVGRLLERKGQEDLLRAFELLCKRDTDANLVIAGDGSFRKSLESVIANLDARKRVDLLGQRTDIPALLAASYAFVFPSHYEGHSGALLEAMFAEKAIIASDIPENRESVEHERTALLVPPKDPAALAEAMWRLLSHPDEARLLGKRAREVALQRFDIRRIAQQHEELYAKVLASTHK